MELKEFQALALRTESRVEAVNIDVQALGDILELLVTVTEMLDGIKKAVFYGKVTKLDENYTGQLHTIRRLADSLAWRSEGHGHPMATKNAATLLNIDPRVFHGIIGMITEGGELGNALLKSVRDPSQQIDAVNVQEEMNDDQWYQAILCDALNLDAGQGLQNVIDKLRIRFADKYSDLAAENRDLAAERAVLERGVHVDVDKLPAEQDYLTGKFDPIEPSPELVSLYGNLSAKIDAAEQRLGGRAGEDLVVFSTGTHEDYFAAALASITPPVVPEPLEDEDGTK